VEGKRVQDTPILKAFKEVVRAKIDKKEKDNKRQAKPRIVRRYRKDEERTGGENPKRVLHARGGVARTVCRDAKSTGNVLL